MSRAFRTGVLGYYEVNDFRTLGSPVAGSTRCTVRTGGASANACTEPGCGWRTTESRHSGRDIRQSRSSSAGRIESLRGFGASYDLSVTERCGCSAAGDDTSTGPNSIWRGRFSAVRSGKPTIARWTLRRVLAGLEQHARSRSLESGCDAFRDRRSIVAGLKSVDPDLKPTSQDQWSAGADYQWKSHGDRRPIHPSEAAPSR